MSPRLPLCLVLLPGLLVASVSGCASWTKDPGAASSMRLPLPPLPSDSVVVEVTFVDLPPDSAALDAELWNEVDEQQLPAELRRRMAANGFRGGLVGSPLPTALRSYLESQKDASPLQLEMGQPLVDELATLQRKRMRAGQRNDIVASPVRDNISVLRLVDGRIVGNTYDQAQCRFAARSYPQGDGRVRVELVPEIHHGEIAQRWVGDDRALRLDAGQQRVTFDELQLEVVLSPGETMLLTCTADSKGLGRHFFADGESPNLRRRMLLIRLSQTQLDDRFARDGIAAPIASTAE